MAIVYHCDNMSFRQQKLLVNQVCAASNAADLRSALAEKIPQVQEEVKAFRKEHGNTKVNKFKNSI